MLTQCHAVVLTLDNCGGCCHCSAFTFCWYYAATYVGGAATVFHILRCWCYLVSKWWCVVEWWCLVFYAPHVKHGDYCATGSVCSIRAHAVPLGLKLISVKPRRHAVYDKMGTYTKTQKESYCDGREYDC